VKKATKSKNTAKSRSSPRSVRQRSRVGLSVNPADPVHHVIVLVLENRSFDHLLGSLKSLYPQLEGIDPANLGINNDGPTAYPQKPGALFQLPYGVDPKHELPDVAEQMAGPCGGFISNFMRNYPNKKASAAQVMAYFDRQGANRLPVLQTLAESFAICDHWYCSVPGPTWPNRFFVHSGTSQGRVIMPSGLFHHWHAYDQDTLYDRLNEQRISWRIYFGDIAQSLMLAHQREPENASNYSPMNHFYVDVTRKESDFPQYVFIEPLYFGGFENDQHPPANMLDGELLLAKVYNAIRMNEELWQKTLFVVLYDEHGGLFDHVLPPEAVPPDDHREEYDFTQYGLRVPALLISPYAPKGVISTDFDHTSLLRYLQDKWQLGPLGARTANANSFTNDLLAAARTDTPAHIPEPNTDAEPLLMGAVAAARLATEKAGPPPMNDLQATLLSFTQVLDAETKEPAEAKARRIRQMVKSPEDHFAAAKERHDRFLAQQRRRAAKG
jgi:phospholipase C